MHGGVHRVATRALSAIVGVLLGLFTALAICSYTDEANRLDPEDLEDVSNWLLIKEYKGELGSNTGRVEARVYAIRRLSGRDRETILQNRIELTQDGKLHVFMWDNNLMYVTGVCDVLDVDGDGTKEFLFGHSRVVWYSQGLFGHRGKPDEIFSFRYDVGPFDFDNDGRLEFVEGAHFPEEASVKDKRIPLPKVMHWTRASGFKDVSKQFPQYYRDTIIPDLEAQRASETDPAMKALYSQALDYVRNELLS